MSRTPPHRAAAALIRAAAVALVLLSSMRRARAQQDSRPAPPRADPAASRPRTRLVDVRERVPLATEPPTGFEIPLRNAGLSPFHRLLVRRLSAAAPEGERMRELYATSLGEAARSLPESMMLRALLWEDAARVLRGEKGATAPPAVVAQAMRQVGEAGLFDPWLIAWAWARADVAVEASQADDLALLYVTLHEHARSAAAHRRRAFEAAPHGAPAWASKAGPRLFRIEWPRPASTSSRPGSDAALAEARRLYSVLDAGTWDSEACLVLRVAGGAAELFRRGGSARLAADEIVDLRRLDVIVAGPTGLRLDHATAGSFVVPPHGVLSSRRALSFLDSAGRARVAAHVSAAADGDEDALRRLEAMLPLAADAISAEVARDSKSAGAPALRLLLTLWEQ
jgi:hypothetical protein